MNAVLLAGLGQRALVKIELRDGKKTLDRFNKLT
jgi:hypothetical protein